VLGSVHCVSGGGHILLQQPAHLSLAPRHFQPGGFSFLQGTGTIKTGIKLCNYGLDCNSKDFDFDTGFNTKS
jgi:hypothetical protein